MSRIAKVINKTKQGIPLLVKDGDSNKSVTVPAKGPDGFIMIAEEKLTGQARRLEAQQKLIIK